jgi:hypothetical protein
MYLYDNQKKLWETQVFWHTILHKVQSILFQFQAWQPNIYQEQHFEKSDLIKQNNYILSRNTTQHNLI